MRKETPFVKFRAVEPEDLDLLYKIENDTSLWDAGNTNVPYSRYALHQYIASATNDIYTDKQVRLMAETKDGNVVGIADIVDFDPRHLRAELGLVILPEYRNQGYGRAVVSNLMNYARKVFHLHQLYVYIDCRNKPSLSLFTNMGFQADIRLKDWLYNGERFNDAWCLQLFL